MRWKKVGKIFDPTQWALSNGCVEFAQSPQALVFDNYVRIYFSTRSLDRNGKYLSQVAFVDMDKNLRDVVCVSRGTVISLGDLGCFDEHGIFPMNVVRHGDSILAYTCGWSRRVSVSVDTAIGLAISRDDGMTFQRTGDGPVLAASAKMNVRHYQRLSGLMGAITCSFAFDSLSIFEEIGIGAIGLVTLGA